MSSLPSLKTWQAWESNAHSGINGQYLPGVLTFDSDPGRGSFLTQRGGVLPHHGLVAAILVKGFFPASSICSVCGEQRFEQIDLSSDEHPPTSPRGHSWFVPSPPTSCRGLRKAGHMQDRVGAFHALCLCLWRALVSCWACREGEVTGRPGAGHTE